MNECVYILLPVHNRKEITRKFIESLITQNFQNYHLLLIDDGSTDGTDDMVRSLVATEKLTVIKGKGNWWWAGSLQQGINWLKKYDVKPSDIVLMINDDVTFESNFLGNGVAFLKRNSESLLLARFYDEEQGKVVETGVKADFRQLSFVEAIAPEDINCLSTRGLFMRWDVCRNVGSFYPQILPHYFSDYEYTMRAKKKGFSLRTIESVHLQSDGNTTGIRDAGQIKDLKTLFDKRCVLNPVYYSMFILLVARVQWMPLNLMKVWFFAGKLMLKIAFLKA